MDTASKITLGERLAVKGTDLIVQFTEVLEDSRCPEGVQCPWAGNARVQFNVNGELLELNTFTQPKSNVVAGFRIELLSLRPYPVKDRPIDSAAYVAEIRIRRDS
ncbi:MAG: hypothetical protein ACQETE_14415 [Bacteroidota bacterium]